MSSKLEAMAIGLRGESETKPRRFDLTMSRRTRRPAATSATNCHGEDHQAVEGIQPMVQPQQQDRDAELNKELTPRCLSLSDHLQSRQPHHQDATHRQEHETSEPCSEDTKEQEEEQECQDNSRRFSLQELIEDEPVKGVKDAAATGAVEENAPAPPPAAAAVLEAAEGGAAAGEAKRPGQAPGRRVIGMMRRYVKVRSIKPKRAPEKNTAPVC